MNSEMPTKLNSASSSAVVSPDKLSVKFNKTLRPITIQSVQSNKPVPVNLGSVYYFEMRVKNAGSETKTAIGYSPEGFDLYIGFTWDPNSIGYHGANGEIYFGGISHPLDVRKKFTINDIVGAGINYVSNEFFFTKNGEVVGTVSKMIDGPLFPTISVFGSDVEVKVNFGHKPFVYDVEIKYPSPYWCGPMNDELRSSTMKVDNNVSINDDSPSSSTKEESWKSLMKKSESMLRKSIEEKEEEVVSLKEAMKALNDNLGKYL